jgi:hypothetical protein
MPEQPTVRWNGVTGLGEDRILRDANPMTDVHAQQIRMRRVAEALGSRVELAQRSANVWPRNRQVVADGIRGVELVGDCHGYETLQRVSDFNRKKRAPRLRARSTAR